MLNEEVDGGQPSTVLVEGAPAAQATPAAPVSAPIPASQAGMGEILNGLAVVMQQMIKSQQLQAEAIVQAITSKQGVSVSELTTPIAIRKLQERSPEFPLYDGNAENFMWWLATVEEKRKLRGLHDEVAIT